MKHTIDIFEMFTGGGTLLSALVAGLSAAGVEVRVRGLVELEAKYLGRSSARHPEASTWNGSAGCFHPAELSMPMADNSVFVAGVPCTGASPAGISKNGLSAPEEHPDVGYLFLPTIHWIRAHRPKFVVLENVPQYQTSVSAECIRAGLRAAGYSFEERVVNSMTEFESPTQRRRWVLVASRDANARFSWIYAARAFKGTLASVLDPESEMDQKDSATPEQVAADSKYCSRKASEGCGFAMTLLDRNSTKCPTIPKSYGKRQPTGTFIKTATSYRMLRPDEVARIHGFETNIFADMPKTLQYEMYGQGVVAQPFKALGLSLAQFITGQRAEVQPVPFGQLELFAC